MGYAMAADAALQRNGINLEAFNHRCCEPRRAQPRAAARSQAEPADASWPCSCLMVLRWCHRRGRAASATQPAGAGPGIPGCQPCNEVKPCVRHLTPLRDGSSLCTAGCTYFRQARASSWAWHMLGEALAPGRASMKHRSAGRGAAWLRHACGVRRPAHRHAKGRLAWRKPGRSGPWACSLCLHIRETVRPAGVSRATAWHG